MSLKRKQYADDTRMLVPAWSNGHRGDGHGCRQHVWCRHSVLPLEHHHKRRFLDRRRTARLAAMQRKESIA